MATVDLDKLSAELTAAGYFAEDTHGDGLLKVGTNTYERYIAHCVVSREGDVHPSRNSKIDWALLDIIRRHVAPVAPDPGLREAIAELRRDITRFANHKMQYGMSFERGDTENAEENRLLAEQLSEKIDAVLAVLAERGVR